MTATERILAGRRLWIGIRGPRLDPETRSHLLDLRPGGIVLFRRNVESLDSVRSLIRDLRKLLGDGLLLSVDHEGGLVTRFHRELTVFPGNMALGAAAFREPSLGEHLGEQQGIVSARELRGLGFDVNLAPVLDLATTGRNPGIGIRSFGAPEELAARLGAAIVRGTLAGGVLPVLKHFPGKGEAALDAHIDLPAVPPGDQTPHLLPFKRAIAEGAPVVMTSHVVFEGIDPGNPATLSERVVRDLLRGELGFRGAVMTDDLEMGAMQKRFGFDTVIRGAVEAGHDVLCICQTYELQRRARDILAAGIRERALWAVDAEETDARLGALRPPPDAAPGSLPAAGSLAEAIAGRAITVHGDPGNLLPVAGKRTLLALPTLDSPTGVENPLRGEEDGSELVAALGSGASVHRLPLEPSVEDVARLLEAAGAFERLLVATTNARFLDAQRRYLVESMAAHPGAVHVAIRSPFDAEAIPASLPAACVFSYGFRPVQLRALARVLLGEVVSYGRCPVAIQRLP